MVYDCHDWRDFHDSYFSAHQQNRILQYFGRISLIVLCIHGPVYRIVVKILSILLRMETDAVRGNFLLAMIVVAATMMVCSAAYEVVVRIVPWMIGKKRKAWNERNTSTI